MPSLRYQQTGPEISIKVYSTSFPSSHLALEIPTVHDSKIFVRRQFPRPWPSTTDDPGKDASGQLPLLKRCWVFRNGPSRGEPYTSPRMSCAGSALREHAANAVLMKGTGTRSGLRFPRLYQMEIGQGLSRNTACWTSPSLRINFKLLQESLEDTHYATVCNLQRNYGERH
jgi:hypothetical protein